LYLTASASPLIFVEKGKNTTTKTIIAQALGNQDEENVDEVVENE
jgi:Na+-driven multidrug efflux pump